MFPTISGPPMDIFIRDGAIPYAQHRPIPIAIHQKDAVKANLYEKVRMGIIEPVPPNTPAEWVSRMIVVPKKDGKCRITQDLRELQVDIATDSSYRVPFCTGIPNKGRNAKIYCGRAQRLPFGTIGKGSKEVHSIHYSMGPVSVSTWDTGREVGR